MAWYLLTVTIAKALWLSLKGKLKLLTEIKWLILRSNSKSGIDRELEPQLQRATKTKKEAGKRIQFRKMTLSPLATVTDNPGSGLFTGLFSNLNNEFECSLTHPCETVLRPALEENRNGFKWLADPLPLCCLWCVDVVQFISARIYSAHTECQAWCPPSKWISGNWNKTHFPQELGVQWSVHLLP